MILAWSAALFITLTAVLLVGARKLLAPPNAAIGRLTPLPRAASARAAARRPALLAMAERLGALAPASPRKAESTRKLLIRAGIRAPNALQILYGSKILLGLVLSLLVLAAVSRPEAKVESPLGYAALAGAGGFLLPDRYVRRRAARRQTAIRRGLPNALDLLVVCVESGLGLDQAMIQASREIRYAHPEICEELGMVNLEIKAGHRRADALRHLADRTGVEDLRKLAAVLIQADRFGTGVGQTLRAHADYLRIQTRQQVEEKAAKLGVKLVFPIFFFILPSLFVVTVGPIAVRVVREILPLMQNM